MISMDTGVCRHCTKGLFLRIVVSSSEGVLRRTTAPGSWCGERSFPLELTAGARANARAGEVPDAWLMALLSAGITCARDGELSATLEG